MSNSSVTSNLSETLDVKSLFTAEIAFYAPSPEEEKEAER